MNSFFLFLGLDPPNYNRWRSVQTGDIKSLNTKAKSVLSKSWVEQKANHRFSTIPLDQAHEEKVALLV